MKMIVSCLFAAILYNATTFAQQRVLDKNMHHLRSTKEREWSSFSTEAKKSLELKFINKSTVKSAHTLQLRQENVRQKWTVSLNQKLLGRLKDDEQTLATYFDIPASYFKAGENILVVEQVNSVADDIRVGELIFIEGTVDKLLSQARVNLLIKEAKSQETIPSHITILNKEYALQPVKAGSSSLAVREGCVYTGNGEASLSVPAGTYTIYAGRGFEYGIDSTVVVLKPGQEINRTLQINREVPTEGWVAMDTHIHTLTHSGHGDASVTERMITIAGEGIEVPVITEHNLVVDVDSLANAMGMRKYFTPVIGSELTTKVGHFNLFPLAPKANIPDPGVKNWNAVGLALDSMERGIVVVLNHARDIHYNYRPFGRRRHIAVAGIDREGQRFPANAMEIMNSSAQLEDYTRLILDWFGMINRGYQLSPIGSSDSHDVGRYLVGQGRTYVKNPDGIPGSINTKTLKDSLLAGKVMVSFGLLAELTVDSVYGPGDIVSVHGPVLASVRVLGPGWINASKVWLYANGKKLEEVTIKKGNGHGVKWTGSWSLPPSTQDYYLVAVSESQVGSVPFWPVPLPYQRTSPDCQPRYMGVSGAVWVDADGDGKRTSAFEYADRLVKNAGDNYRELLNKLNEYDEAVSIQAAGILFGKGIDLRENTFLEKLNNSAIKVREGFRIFTNEVTGNNLVN